MAESDQTMLLPFKIVFSETDPTAVLYILFKDTTNGKKYNLQVTNGAVEVVEVV
jgi:hypothetical protein